MRFGVRVSLVAAWLVLASCKRSPSVASDPGDAAAPARPSTVVVIDGGAPREGEGEGSWSCDETAARIQALPSEPIAGALALPAGGGAPVFTFVSSEGGRKHRAFSLGEPPRVVEGPGVLGDAPPWVPAFAGESLRFVRLEPGSPARVVLSDAAASRAEIPLTIGDELAVDAAGAGTTFVVAASSSRGVDVRVGSGSVADSSFVVDDAYGPAVLVDPRGAVSVAARVDAALDQPKPTKDVPTANLEGAGQERLASSIVVVAATGKRLASHAIPAGAEVLGVTAGREAILVASSRVARGGRTVDVDAIRADGRRERVGEFQAHRGGRLVPIAGSGGDVVRAVLEVLDEGVAVLGARAGEVPLRDVESAFGVRQEGESLTFWALREREGARSLGPVRCAWRGR